MIRALAVILLLLNCTWLIHWPDRRGARIVGSFTELGFTCRPADREHIIELSSDSIELIGLAFYAVLVLAGTSNEFIYFQF